jgi:predicted transcriptional regulator YdeE
MRGPTIVESSGILVVGLNFFGDPFESSAGWTEENEIGRLWKRMIRYMDEHPDAIRHPRDPDAMLEIHLWNETTERTGEYDVFVGMTVTDLAAVPVDLLIKVLPATTYAVFTLEGEEIPGDWAKSIYAEALPAAGYQTAHDYMIQWYDERFRGIDRVADSELDVYIPVKPA